MIVNSNSVVQHVIQIKNGIFTNASMSVKNITCTKKIIVGILVYEFVRWVGI